MKIRLSSEKMTVAAALFFTVVLLALVAGFIASYMLLTHNEYVSVGRSQVWNASLANAESGVEEALAMINCTNNTPGGYTNWLSATSADGWSTSASYKTIYAWANTNNNTVYRMIRTNFNSGNKIGAGRYEVYINYSAANAAQPEIYSIGYADWLNGETTAGAAARKIYVQTLNAGQLGDNGLIAYTLTFNGNNVTMDSFDSTSSAHSIWSTNLWFRGANYGTWSSSLSYNSNTIPSRTANIHVATETQSIDVGNANIYGYVNTAPGGTYTIKNNGSVGDLNWVHSGTSGLESGHFKDDMNQTFTSVSPPTSFANSVQNNNWLPVTTFKTIAPSNSWFWVTAVIVTGKKGSTTTNSADVIRIGGVYSNGILVGAGTLYTNSGSGWALPGGDGNTYTFNDVIPNRPEATNNIYYGMNSIGSDNLYVDSAYTVIYATNGMSSPTLTINTNADVFIYSGGDITFGGTINNTALARACTICDILGNPISVTASGNASGVSKLYIPSSSIKLNGGGNNTYDIIGEIIANSADFNGHFNLHFDESLNTNTPAQKFVGIAWKEITGY